MFRKILVPVDGSKLADRAVPQAGELARRFEGEVIVLRVTPLVASLADMGPDDVVPVDFPTLEHRERELAQAHLDRLRQMLEQSKVRVHTRVERGDPAQQITDFAEREKVDLVVMCSHGRTGLARWIYGSVAEKVLHHVDCPLLLVRIPPSELTASTS